MSEIRFDVPDESISEDVSLISTANGIISRLKEMRAPFIEREGRYLQSKLAWKAATYRETILYRTVSLCESLALNWNSRNILGCSLSARALIETSALLLEFEHDLVEYIDKRDLEAINDLLTNRHFATRKKEWLENHPETQATNILTYIDKVDKRMLNGIREIYVSLSESCHPNYLGLHGLFSSLNTKTGRTDYSASKDFIGRSHAIMVSMMLVGFVENCAERLNTLVDRIAELQVT